MNSQVKRLACTLHGVECEGFKQRWSRGHKARGQGQGHKKNPRPRPRPRTAFPRTDTLEAKARNARGQGQGRRTQSASALQKKKKKKKGLHKNFSSDLHEKNVFQKIFQPLHKILTFKKIVLSSSRGQANFRGLEASRPRPRTWPSRAKAKAKDFKICPRGRPRGQGRPQGLHLWFQDYTSALPVHFVNPKAECALRSMQYLDCKILHEGCFCSLHQTHSECETL